MQVGSSDHHHSQMNRCPAALAIAMSYRPYLRGNRPQRGRGYSNNPTNSEPDFVSGDSHHRAVSDANRGFRPAYNAVPPPPVYYSGQQPGGGPWPGPPYPRQFPGPSPYRQRPPRYGNNYNNNSSNNNQQFRPRQMQQQQQQQFRPRASKPPDFREWEYAVSPPPPDCERFTVLSYNILADYLVADHWQKLYYHIPHYMLDWNWRKRNICFELGLWSADILCFQEVDRFQDIQAELEHRGYNGIWKMRTGVPVDGCAIFWRVSRFKLLHEESIEYNKLDLRDNVAQICVFESLNGQNNTNGVSPLSTSLANSNKVVVCNIHVLFNPRRGEIKLGQIRVLLDRAHTVSKLWDDAPVVICGDFNCTPKSPLYNFIREQKLDLSELPRDKVSGQETAEIRPSRPNYPGFRTQPSQGVLTGSLNGAQHDSQSHIHTVRGDLEPSSEGIHSKATDIRVSVETTFVTEASGTFNYEASQIECPPNSLSSSSFEVSSSENEAGGFSFQAANDNHHTSTNLESTSRESITADSVLDEKFESLSLEELVDETKDEHLEDCDSFLSELHNTGQNLSPSDVSYSFHDQELHSRGNETVSDAQYSKDEVVVDEGISMYNPSAWTPMETQTATGRADCKVMEHPLKLTSAYAEVENSSGLRDPSGEPLVTSYHRNFLGTVDYIWHSEGLQTAKVLAPIPKHVMQQTRGFPTKKWGSDHIALVSELAFTKRSTDSKAANQ